MGPFLVQQMKKNILKKINSVKGLVSGHFFYIKRPINVESHMYKVPKGQTISKANYGVLNSSKKRTKLTILHREDAQ